AGSTLADVAFAVCTALERGGITAVLTGGSAATYHAPAAIQSDDLDFIITMHAPNGDALLRSIGYGRQADYYVHDASPLPLEFPPGPLAVGDDLITSWQTVRRRREVLHVLSPTDSCRDRLAGFLFWNDFASLEQAIAVHAACRDRVDLDRVRDWCVRERQPHKYDLFARRLAR